MHAKIVSNALIESDDDLIAEVEVKRISGLGSGEIFERRKLGTFPQPVDVSATPHSRKRANRWLRREVKAWVKERVLERDLRLAREREEARRDRELLEAGREQKAADRVPADV